jgi:hypothetical protein
LREQGGTEDKKSLVGQCYDFDIFTGKFWKKFGKNWKFFKKEVDRGGERTRVFSISFIFSFSPFYR